MPPWRGAGQHARFGIGRGGMLSARARILRTCLRGWCFSRNAPEKAPGSSEVALEFWLRAWDQQSNVTGSRGPNVFIKVCEKAIQEPQSQLDFAAESVPV